MQKIVAAGLRNETEAGFGWPERGQVPSCSLDVGMCVSVPVVDDLVPPPMLVKT